MLEFRMPESRAALSPAAASLAAIGSVLAASSCCLPILPFAMAAGAAGSAAFLNVARPYLLAASILFIAFGFWQASYAKKCHRKPSAVSAALLWFSTIFVALSLFFPQAMAGIAADLLSH
jgi:putative Ca2+/H+ antiporter (TMEM165/GDT1 family)